MLCVLGCHRCSVGFVRWFSAQCWSLVCGDLSMLFVVTQCNVSRGVVCCTVSCHRQTVREAVAHASV